ncbi:MAG: hypothetical protein AAGA56_18835, partial [Myxococcota bacterium]
AVCGCDCRAREILISEAAGIPPLDNADGSKSDLAIAFAGAAGNDIAGSLRSVFTDRSDAASNTVPDINYRVMRRDLFPAEPPLNQQLRLPRTCEGANIVTPNGLAREQFDPDIARVSPELMVTVWVDDFTEAGNHDVRGGTLREVGCSDQAFPLTLNQNRNNPLRFPAVAGGPPNVALVVWADGSTVRGRIWSATTDELLPAAGDIEIGSGAADAAPQVAGNNSGWVVTYGGPSNDGDVVLKTVDLAGVVGPETRVNIIEDGRQDQPAVAMLVDGRYIVVWRSDDRILYQRYDADGEQVSGDQDAPLSRDSPPGSRPAVAASTDSGTFFAAAWEAEDGAVWARLIDADAAFLRNSVDGLFGDFIASDATLTGSRTGADVAIGAEFIAFGWNAPNGVFTRRFPFPEE